MITEATAAFAVGVATLIVTVVGMPALLARVRTLENIITLLQSRQETLWRIYGEDAIVATRDRGLADQNSPITLNDQWRRVTPTWLRYRVVWQSRRLLTDGLDKWQTAAEVYDQNHEAFEQIGKENDIGQKALLGGVVLMVEGVEKGDKVE